MDSHLSNSSMWPLLPIPICVRFRTEKILSSTIRYFDALILVPNVVFLLFLVIKCLHARAKLNASKPLLLSVSCLILTVTFINLVRCSLAIIFDGQTFHAQGVILKLLWLLLRFTLLCTELSVLLFGICFGRFDPNRQWAHTIKILIVSSICASIYTITQGVLEFRGDTRPTGYVSNNYNLYSYGGMKFLLTSSSIFLIMYIIIFFLPCLCRRHRKHLPIRRSFYFYCLILALINMIQVIGTVLNLTESTPFGMCIVDGTTCLFYICFAPFVYRQFLQRALSSRTLVPQVMYADSTIDGNDDDHDDDNLLDVGINTTFYDSHNSMFHSTLVDYTSGNQTCLIDSDDNDKFEDVADSTALLTSSSSTDHHLVQT